MLHVGLTGGIGAGKSAVSASLRSHGAHILDADQLARELLAPGSEVLEEVVAAFGDDLLDPDGRLVRQRLAERVFADPAARARLDGILHPRINALERERAAAIAARLPEAVIVYEAPLLLESGAGREVDRILVVDLPEALQRERAIARGDRDPDQVRAIMAAQCSREERLSRAHDVIDNSGSWAATEQQIGALMERYRELAAGPGSLRR
jgi:dephospho-CoA kinase